MNVSDGRWSLRAQVRVALLCAILLVFPQVGLTLYYLDQIRDVAAQSASRAMFVVITDGIQHRVERVELPKLPSGATPQTREALLDELSALERRAQGLADATSPEFEPFSAELVDALTAVRGRANAWFDTVAAASAIFPSIEALDALSQNPEESDLDLLTPRQEFVESRAAALDLLKGHTVGALESLRQEEAFAQRIVNHADRNLFTLTMLTFLLLAVIFVVLPERVVRPIRRLTQAIRAAAHAPREARANIGGDDELALLGRTFNETMDTLSHFDERKRERIVADAAKVDTLLERVGCPTAVLTLQLNLEACNKAFRTLFEVAPDDLDRPITTLFADGADALRQVLVRVTAKGEVVEDHDIELLGAAEPGHYRLSVDLCRDRRGRASNLVVYLHHVS